MNTTCQQASSAIRREPAPRTHWEPKQMSRQALDAAPEISGQRAMARSSHARSKPRGTVTRYLWIFCAVASLAMLVPLLYGQNGGPSPEARDSVLPRITIRVEPTGVYPQQIRLKPGKYIIDVQNAGVIGDIPVSILTSSRANLAQTSMNRSSRRQYMSVELVPGSYTLQTLPGDAYSCELTVASGVLNTGVSGVKTHQ